MSKSDVQNIDVLKKKKSFTWILPHQNDNWIW